MQPFTVILVIGAVILSCGPRFSATAPAPYSIRYNTQDGVKLISIEEGICQILPNEAHSFINTTPDIILAFLDSACRGQPFPVPPGRIHQGTPQFFSVLMP
ncbi:hypothetical protein K450DRAFT_216633 [Umbelopsis ramanniana AG]|uniref:Uncharacterized protein n=1 Tax=Umbelopsis ramanniana AG TaxID=1314678 RepID=A0AAD5HIX2_UMBRA|nr:uncharacterized protein K450DRAFT_216633 [Umbelopsis ramanniana AG]KAI8584489.1 hypothetical protein K450DRAFT_216633 [Umbelopsis ramanniana AG]